MLGTFEGELLGREEMDGAMLGSMLGSLAEKHKLE